MDMTEDNMRAKIERDAAYYKTLFEELISEGRFCENQTNSGTKYSGEPEFADLLRFAENLKSSDSLSFIGGGANA